MAIINQNTKVLQVKIVYYGPPMSGKTTNLVMFRDALETEGSTGKLVSRQLVLRGVDGVVFVADSQDESMSENVESFENLHDDLRNLKLNPDEIPYVLQYNKRDAPDVAALERMEALLNKRRVKVPFFPSDRSRGYWSLGTV